MMMDEEKRMMDTYEIKHSIHVGDKEVLFGVDESKPDCPYVVCNCSWDNPFGIDQFFNVVGSADYLEIMTEFTLRVNAQIQAVKAERDKVAIPLEPFTAVHCYQNNYKKSIENEVVVLRPERLRPEYRTANNQLLLATGGFGTHANSRGRAVYTVNLYSGKESRWNREDLLGVLKSECMPEWAKEKLRHIQTQRQEMHKKYEPER